MRLRFLVAATAMLVLSLAARAETFSFSYSGSGYSGTGILTGAASGTAGQFLISGISGTANGSSITSLFAPGTFPTSDPPANDNLLSLASSTTYFDLNGISFGTSAGDHYNIYYGYSNFSKTSAYNILSGTGTSATSGGAITSISVAQNTTAVTPEPSTFALLGTGILGVIGAARRRFA